MAKYERKTYSGVVMEREFYVGKDSLAEVKDIERRLWKPKTAEEKKAANDKHSLKRLQRTVNATFAEGGLYVTMTYDDKHLPKTREEAEHTASLYIKRLQYSFPDVKIILVTGFGVESGRLHHHMIIQGAYEKTIIKKWNCGMVTRIEPLRAHNVYHGNDHGRDYTALSTYLFRHSADKTSGKRWKQTRSVTAPEAETPKEVKRTYSATKPPRTPKGYRLVEAREGRYGYLYFKYIKNVKTDGDNYRIFKE